MRIIHEVKERIYIRLRDGEFVHTGIDQHLTAHFDAELVIMNKK